MFFTTGMNAIQGPFEKGILCNQHMNKSLMIYVYRFRISPDIHQETVALRKCVCEYICTFFSYMQQDQHKLPQESNVNIPRPQPLPFYSE